MHTLFESRLAEAAQRFGTPLYAYDWSETRSRAQALREAFGSARIFYAMKANPNLGLLRRMHSQLGIGFEAVSGGELERALMAGAKGSQIVLNGPGKLGNDYARAKEVGAILILDNKDEALRAAQFAPKAQALIRVNPGLKVSTHDHLATGSATSKFGVRLLDVAEALQKAEQSGLEVIGLHVHIGSSIENPSDYAVALERVAELAKITGPRPVFNMGGGFGLHFDLKPLAKLAWEAAGMFGAEELWLEPGRWFIATAGVMLTTVLEVKQTGRKFAVCDAGMSELIRPMLYGAIHPVKNLSAEGSSPHWDLAGPACESGDVLARDLSIPFPKPGDLLAVLDAGAYGASMFSNYLTRPRPAEALLENGEWQLLRRRDTLQEMLAAEVSVQD